MISDRLKRSDPTGEKMAVQEDDYLQLFDFASDGSYIYIGKATMGTPTSDSTWQIKKVTFDANSNPSTIKYASGVSSFNQIWDNRASLTYS